MARWPVIGRISQGVEVMWLLQKAFRFPNATEGTADDGQALIVGREVVQTCHTHGFIGSMNEELRGTTGGEGARKMTQLLDFSAAYDRNRLARKDIVIVIWTHHTKTRQHRYVSCSC
jgi:hypothetical protein